jgi:hypothetical protein
MGLRFLLISVILAANLFGWPQVAHEESGKSGTPKGQPYANSQPVPPVRIVIENPVPTIRTQPIADPQQGQPPEKPFHGLSDRSGSSYTSRQYMWPLAY